MIGIVVVSHSPALARAAVDLAQQMVTGAGPVVEIAAGADGRLGTDDGWWPTTQVGLPPMPFEIVAERGGVGYGRFVVDGRRAHPDATALRVAKVLADQTATALARTRSS